MPKREPSDARRRDVHAVDDDGMLACNPRDREAAHRAEVADILTSSIPEQVTCAKCLVALRRAKT
jgi:hypothetical protein